MLIVRGANFHCYEIEDAIGALAGIATARVAATSVRDEVHGTEALLIFFVPSERLAISALSHLHLDGVLIEALRLLVLAVLKAVSSAFGLTPRYAIPLADVAFPRTTSGKIMRGTMRASFLHGAYNRARTALDLALDDASTCAFPDYFAAPVWVRRPPHHVDALPGVDQRRVLLLAPPSHADGLRQDFSTTSEVVVGDGSAGWRALLTLLHKTRPTHIVHAMMLISANPGDDCCACASSASAACSSLLDLAKAMRSWLESSACSSLASAPMLLCVRYHSILSTGNAADATSSAAESEADRVLGYEAGGAAMISSLCKALSAELSRMARAAVIHVPHASSVQVAAAIGPPPTLTLPLCLCEPPLSVFGASHCHLAVCGRGVGGRIGSHMCTRHGRDVPLPCAQYGQVRDALPLSWRGAAG